MPDVLERRAAFPGNPFRDVDPASRPLVLRGCLVEKFRGRRLENGGEPEDSLGEDRFAPLQRIVGRATDTGFLEDTRKRHPAGRAAPSNRSIVEFHVDNVLFNSTTIKARYAGSSRTRVRVRPRNTTAICTQAAFHAAGNSRDEREPHASARRNDEVLDVWVSHAAAPACQRVRTRRLRVHARALENAQVALVQQRHG